MCAFELSILPGILLWIQSPASGGEKHIQIGSDVLWYLHCLTSRICNSVKINEIGLRNRRP